ncbi:hypothetical protein C1646_750803 [Rhizophagus diaphanus]|nr:hypothetical protein C1646_750803 [Rhizophagus diaphanus] [Rhizophagus sp. MUCL 43196]
MLPETNFQSNITQDNFIREFPNKKKRKSPNGFIKYRTVEWQRFKKKYPNVTTQQFSSIAAEQWHRMTDSEKNYYIKLKLDKRPKKNNRDGPKQKYDKKNNENNENNERDLSAESSLFHLQLDFNNYNENLNFINSTNQEDENFLLPYTSYSLYDDANIFFDFDF